MRQLWFDLRASLRQADETIAGHRAGTGEPWLVVDVVDPRLWFTPVNAPRPRSVMIAAVHRDGPPAPQVPQPLYRQPLTAPGSDGTSLLDRLRAAAWQGHRWLVIDTSTPPQVYTAASYDADTVPDTAVWTPAWLAAGDLGPYPGQIAHGYQHHGFAVARFTAQTLAWIAADADARAASFPQRPADLLVLRDYGSGVEVLVVRAAGMSTGGLTRRGEAPVGMRRITADADGWYRLADDRWPWRHADSPITAPRRQRGAGQAPGPDVFEPHGPDDVRCTVCGATGYDIAHDEAPSMAGYGTDTTTWCRICRSADSYAEEIGWTSRRAIWPPAADPAPAAEPRLP
ncbi:hypothetical protein [Micromonospora globbae]|uniref:Uncharacterized protein n=1 Tax=Micromonospora globbae TaxID=1894969 RepID=A0A420EQ52_9ACTN|nr:hypothetical protein [Micromonospora globbae]RKF22815.1 hypothetical protein D7I43_31330 [Micromonospora globbae]